MNIIHFDNVSFRPLNLKTSFILDCITRDPHIEAIEAYWRWSKNKRIQPAFKSMSAPGSSLTTMQSYPHVPNTKKWNKACNNASNVIIHFSSHIGVLIIPKSHSESSLSLQRRCLIALFGASQMHLIKNVTHWTAAMIWSLKCLSHHVSDDSKWPWRIIIFARITALMMPVVVRIKQLMWIDCDSTWEPWHLVFNLFESRWLFNVAPGYHRLLPLLWRYVSDWESGFFSLHHLFFCSQNNSSPWYQQPNSTMSSSSMQSLPAWTLLFPTPKRLLPWRGSWIR